MNEKFNMARYVAWCRLHNVKPQFVKNLDLYLAEEEL